MPTNVLIKEVENLNISKDDDDVTVTSHEVEKVTDGNENVEDIKTPMGPTELRSNTKSGKNELSKSDIADIVKKQLE